MHMNKSDMDARYYSFGLAVVGDRVEIFVSSFHICFTFEQGIFLPTASLSPIKFIIYLAINFSFQILRRIYRLYIPITRLVEQFFQASQMGEECDLWYFILNKNIVTNFY